MHCQQGVKELQLHFLSLQAREWMLRHLRDNCQLYTVHLRPAERNMPVRADDFSVENANNAYAYNGYLGITVRMHYFSKHDRKLRYPYLPCVMEFGGGQHVSYFPLEILACMPLSASAQATATTAIKWSPSLLLATNTATAGEKVGGIESLTSSHIH